MPQAEINPGQIAKLLSELEDGEDWNDFDPAAAVKLLPDPSTVEPKPITANPPRRGRPKPVEETAVVPKEKKRYISKYDAGMKAFEEAITKDGGAFLEGCRFMSRDSKWFALAIMIVHPRWVNVSLGFKCQKLGISLDELKAFHKKTLNSIGEIGMMQHVPDVLNATARAAQPGKESCPACYGTGFALTEPKDGEAGKGESCAHCKGKGEIATAANEAARDAVLEIAGLIAGKSKGGFTVNNNLNLPVNSVEDVASEIGNILNVTPE